MRIKVLNGTATDNGHLCDSCQASVRRVEGNREMYYCHDFSKRIHARVTECSGYSHRNEQPARRFRETAWMLDRDVDGVSLVWTTPTDGKLRVVAGEVVAVPPRRRNRAADPELEPVEVG